MKIASNTTKHPQKYPSYYAFNIQKCFKFCDTQQAREYAKLVDEMHLFWKHLDNVCLKNRINKIHKKNFNLGKRKSRKEKIKVKINPKEKNKDNISWCQYLKEGTCYTKDIPKLPESDAIKRLKDETNVMIQEILEILNYFDGEKRQSLWNEVFSFN